MNLKQLPEGVILSGDPTWRGKCPSESAEQVTLIRRIREHPMGACVIHPRNEGKRNHYQASRQKVEGMTTGAADVIVPGCPAFVCELKRKDHTKSRWQDGQQKYLSDCVANGAFAVVALGVDAAWQAYQQWAAQCESQ